jgi:lipopolysaccharide export system protein LptA
MFVFNFSNDLDIDKYEYELYNNQAGTGTPTSAGFNSANVFTVAVPNSTDTVAKSYWGRVRSVDTTGNLGPWTVLVQTDQSTPLIDNQYISNLTASKITAGTIGAHTITLAGTNSILKSNNYAAATANTGGAGWKISGDGKAVFNDASIRSSLDIGEDQGTSDATSFHVDANGNMWSGANSSSFSTAPFKVTNTGDVTANSLVLTGITKLSNSGNASLFLTNNADGIGLYNNANTAFYVDATDQFSLGNKLTWANNTLTIQGNLKLNDGSDVLNGDDVTDILEEAVYVDGFIGGLTITANTMYYGTGSFASSNTAFYVGKNASNQANFSLGDKLTWNGNTLAIQGALKLADGSDVINAEDVEIIVDEFGNEIQDGFIGGLTINSTQMYYGTGTFASSDTAFYVAKNASTNQADFSLGDKLTWNGATLAISGNVTATSGSIAGILIENAKISKDPTSGGITEDTSSASGLEITNEGVAKFSQVNTPTVGALGGAYLSFGNQVRVVNSGSVTNPTGVLALKNIRYSSSDPATEPTGSLNLRAGDIWLS